MDNQNPIYRPLRGSTSNLTRYGSAPTSLLNSLVDSINGSGPSEPANTTTLPMSRFFNGSSSNDNHHMSYSDNFSTSSTSATNHVGSSYQVGEDSKQLHSGGGGGGGRGGEGEGGSGGGGGGCGGGLLRHSSSPAGFFSNLLVDNNAFTLGRSIGNYPEPSCNGVHAMPSTRIKTQLSFSRQDPLSQISEVSIPEMAEGLGNSSDEAAGNQSYITNNYSIGSWDEGNSIAFSAPSNKRRRDGSDDFFGHLDSQLSLPTTSLEMATMDKFFQSQQDSVAFKVRAKRGCATHPRSIAERERRTRISEKLRKLQELVPNMDKQTSTSDMLDLAVQHIKELQSQIQDLNQDRANCKCASKEDSS